MTQKLLLVAFFALIVGIISVPVPCASGTGVLEVGETLSVDSLSVHRPPKYTCEFVCPCGPTVYFDVRKLPGYSSWSSKWHNYCQREDPGFFFNLI